MPEHRAYHGIAAAFIDGWLLVVQHLATGDLWSGARRTHGER